MQFRAFPTVLPIYLSGRMFAAWGDLRARGRATPPELYERFVSWAHHH
ncbi:hypothetical protein [Actinoplanes sp. NPDC026619]